MKIIILSKFKINSLEINESCIRDAELVFDELIDLLRDGNTFIVKNEEQAEYILTKNSLLKYVYNLNIEKGELK